MTTASQFNKISSRNVTSVVDQILNDLPILKDKLKQTFDNEQLNCQDALTEGIKFLTLAGATPASLTPSNPVDLVWHEFLLFTKYYADFCMENFGRFLHHLPDDNKSRNHRQFQKTLGLYSLYFGEPPIEYWGESSFTKDSNVACGSCQTFNEKE
ncbi:MAG: hypothetical protein COA79_09930 [Planctomycetota bacterium]|nr:MAG: hypothetical protein COA79_09930 [Planctomycetota bacterium]